MIDPDTGKPKRVSQYLVALEADIDMGKVFQADHAPSLSGPDAAAMLMAPTEAAEYVEPEMAEDIEPDDEKAAIKRLRSVVFEALQESGIETDRFAQYASLTLGAHWSHDLDALEKAKDELIHAKDNLPAYLEQIDQALRNDTPF